MELVFPFKNITTNQLLDFIDERENIRDFILTKQDKYPYDKNYFHSRVQRFKDSLPNFENEILQIINTTNQNTIDKYFDELVSNANYVSDKRKIHQIEANVKEWNTNYMKSFEDEVERLTDEYFRSDNRKMNHLEEYETWENKSFLAIGYGIRADTKKVKRVNYNFYCIEKFPDLIDENYCEQYENFVAELVLEYFEIAMKYITPYTKGEIVSKVIEISFSKPVVFVEGEHDITYIRKAATLLLCEDILEKVELRQRGGYSNLDKLWDIYKDNNWETIPQKKLLLYDCDTKKANDERGTVFKRIVETNEENIICKGIENLFPNSLIEKAITHKRAFVDVTKVYRVRRGIETEEISYIVNEDEKKNLCDWICENGTEADFINFKVVFELINIVL